MEKPASEIPIYKICHLRSPDDISDQVAESTAARSSSLSPEYNVLYVFYGNVEFTTDEGRVVNINDIFIQEQENPFFKTIFSDYELYAIRQNEIKVVFLPERIYPDDSIETIKKKFLYLTRDKVGLSYSELYFFCKQVKTITTQMAHDHITSNGKLEMTPVRVHNYLLNIDNQPMAMPASASAPASPQEYAKLGQPAGGVTGNYAYTNIANLKLEEKPRIINVTMGQDLNIASTYEYPYVANPFDAVYADPFLEIHATEIVNTTNKIVLIDYGVFLHNTIYVVTAEDALVYAKEINIVDPSVAGGAAAASAAASASAAPGKLIYESYIVQLYFPYLSTYRDDTRHLPVEQGSAEASGEADLATIHSRETLLLHKLKLFDADKKILNERFMRQTANIKLLYDIYERRTSQQNYIDDGIRGVELMIHPETPYNQSLDTVFKLIHCSQYIPYIKYNPGKKRDNIYKLYISGISRSGRKIPYLAKSDIFRLIKTTARKKSVSMYIQYTYSNPEVPDHKATHLPIPIICEFYPDGSVYVKLFVKFSFTTTDIESIIKATVNPVLRVIKEHVEQSGFQMTLFSKLYHPQIELINMEYLAQIAITRNIEIKQMIKCISSAFNEIEGSLKKGIVLRYKRVSNYNDMSSQDAYIIEMMNKRQSDRDIIDGLRDNYMMSESDARVKLSGVLSSLQTQQVSRFRGGNIRIKNNPGFLTKITKGAFNNIITIDITNINNVLFLPVLHIYIDSIIRIYQNPGTTDIPYDKIAELCASAAASAAYAASAAVASTRSKPDDSSASSESESESAVVGDIDPSGREEAVEVMPEIAPVMKKPTAAAAAAAAAPLVFGFEAEPDVIVGAKQGPEKEVDLFDLLQGDDDDDDDDDDAGGGAGGAQDGGAGAAAAAPKKRKSASAGPAASEADEDLSDITGMELANPNPFSKRIQERDPVIHLNEDVGKFNAYSRSCPWNVRRQPVILTSEEKARIDREHPDSYSHSITYGSDASKQYHYICPRYWSLKHNTSLTEEEVKSGEFGTVIPSKAKKVPPGANIFEFTDDKVHVDEKGNYKQHYPGFLKKDAHPKGLCVPCCFAQWDKPSQTSRRQECESKQFEAVRTTDTKAAVQGDDVVVDEEPAAATAATAAAAPPHQHPPPPPERVNINEMKDDRILSSDKFPLENNRWGYLPVQVQKFLFTDSRNCQVSIKNTAIKKDTPCLLRRGVETNDRQSFVSAIAYYFKESIGLTSTTVIAPEHSLGVAAAAKTGVKSKMRETISASVNSEPLLATEGGLSLKERISRTISENIQKQAVQINKASGGAVAAQATPPVPRFPQGEPAPAGLDAALPPQEENEYHSEDETPVAMTPRVSASASAAAAATSAASATSAPVVLASTAIPTIREMRNIIIESLDIDTFVTLNNGTLSDVFYNPNKELLEADMAKYNVANISRTLPPQRFAQVCNAYENFIAYLDDDNSIIDHTYLWDIVSRPNDKLFKNGNNIILIHIPDDDITNNVQVICPTNAYSGEVFDANRKTIIIMKRDTYYEPIYLFESKSNGKFSVLGRFAIKSKTLMPKIKHVIENIRDLYFSYCRLHASQPREYRYKMNQPAHVIAKIVKDAGFEIHAQVMNFNGKVIGLQISQTLTTTKLNPSGAVKKTSSRKRWMGVIPTAVSAPAPASAASASAAPPIASVMMDDDETLWNMSYRETVDFLETVASHVKKVTKKDIFCRPKVKVVEDGLVVGVITETNQFIQVNIDKDPQLNQDDGLPTITESNHLVADKEIASKPEGSIDKKRERYVRHIRLETNFYNVFRNTARNVLNRPENKSIKDDIEKLIASPFMIYQNKLSQIIAQMKRMLMKYVAFIRYSKDTLKLVGEISGCITSDDETCGKKSYCLKESGGMCKLLLPQRNLMYPDIDNEIAYFGKLADEMIRYERVKLFMFEPTKYLSFQDRKYDLHDSEIILLETFITQEYFENLEPVDANPYVFQTSFYTVAPSNAGSRGIQSYDPVYRKEYVDRYLELESSGSNAAAAAPKPAPLVAAAAPLDAAPLDAALFDAPEAALQINEINHVLDFCHQVSKRKITEKMKQLFFPTSNTFEILFSNESNECSFDVMLTILRMIAQNASKCPSGHSCVSQKPNPLKFQSMKTSGPASASEAETEICQKCRTSIGHDHNEFACRQCNYFMCENCRHQHVDQLADMSIQKIKNILVGEYDKLAEKGLGKKLTMILNGYGMKKYADIINEERATLSQIIQSENYFLTNIDVWILAVYFKIPIVYVSQSLLSENGKNMMVLYGDDDSNSYFFVHPFTVTQDVPSRFGLIEVKEDEYSLIKVPLEFVTPELRENIQSENDEHVSLEEYIRTFKLGNIKNKKRVFTMTEPAAVPVDDGGGGAAAAAALTPLPAPVPALAAAMPLLSSNVSLFQ
jgi:hypothetical protein